jgi:hypothetical protein
MQITELKVLGDTGREYVISARDGVVTCTCPANRFRGGVCKHMLFAAGALNLVEGPMFSVVK